MLINSNTEWGKLKSVIVGNGFSGDLPNIEMSFKLFYHDNLYKGRSRGYEYGVDKISKEYVHEMSEDVEQFAKTLSNSGIDVFRPKVPTKLPKVSTPAFSSTIHNALNVRDQAIIIGNNIIETPPCTRFRYFENDLMKHIFMEGSQDNGMWVQCPKPIMTDASFDLSYLEDDHITIDPHAMDVGFEMMWDGAQCMRLGRDILFNCSNENHRMGLRWLQRYLGDSYTVHEMNVCDNHIDSSIIPLKPGVFLVDADKASKIYKQLPDKFKGWAFILSPDRIERTYSDKELKLASSAIDINVLSLSEDLVVCEERYLSKLAPELKKHGIDTVGTPMRHSQLFSGSLHCLTLDLERE